MAAGMVWWGLVGTQDVNAINCCSVFVSVLCCVVLCWEWELTNISTRHFNYFWRENATSP